ncbi:hypothetical protein ACJJIF_10960 [Microbulbifer sp. SSSA002]
MYDFQCIRRVDRCADIFRVLRELAIYRTTINRHRPLLRLDFT